MLQESVSKLVYRVLKAYDIPITYHTVDQTLRMHPEYPSVQSISDAFDIWKVKHVVAKLTIEKLRALDVPVIAHLKRGDYVWVTQITDTKVHFLSSSGKGKTESHERFEKEWSGVVLAIEDITDAGEPDYRNERSKAIKERLIKYAFSAGFLVLLTLLTCLSWQKDDTLAFLPKILLLVINAAGCFISYILIRQEKLQSFNRLVQKFCKAGTHIDCNQVTQSHYSKLFGLISWAEVGMAYFSAVILWLAVAPFNAGWLSPLWLLVLVPLPFTVWSLFTQAFLIRKWCLFCCAIVCLLWGNACITFFFLPCISVMPVVESALLALLVLICTAAVMYITQTNTTDDKYAEQRETARIKYNYQTIQCHLAESRFETGNIGFVWGNKHSAQEITLYVSIACSYCGKAVQELKRLTGMYPDFCYRLIFSVKTNDFEHKSIVIISHFISLYKTMNKNEFFDMLGAWYTTLNKNLEALQKTYPAPSAQDCIEEINALYQFDQEAKVSYTPATLLNGRLLSQLYSWEDLFGITRTLNAEE